MDFGARGKRMKATDHLIGPIYEDLLIKVLCRLPPKSLIQCSCVCKAWFQLIDRYCVPQITPSLPFLGCHMYFKTNSKIRVVGLASMPKVEADVDDWPHICNPMVGPGLFEDDFRSRKHLLESYPGFMEDFFHSPKHLIHSCNGLMLFMHPTRCVYVLWNPNTKQFLFISSPNSAEKHLPFAALAVEPTWKLDRKSDFFKIIAFPKDKDVVEIMSSSKCSWVGRKVEYNRPIDNDTFTKGKRSSQKFVYFHGRLFTLCRPRLLLWYTIADDDVDVICDYVKLPSSGDHSGSGSRSRSGRKEGCIGSCGDHIQFAQNDEGGSLVQIWAFSVDAREWIFMHRVSFEALVEYPPTVDLSSMFPTGKAKFKVLAFDPISDDGVIIWTPYRIFCYYCKSGNLVSLQCPEILNGALKDPPRDTFPFTPCLTPLLYKGGGGKYIIKVAKLPDGSSATWINHTVEKKIEIVSTELCSLLL